mgnify:CR=1 FL=1|tara:strand:+ start:198 stop:1115 length:918 start_codon:yes stop_codon:yes gene_type:complete
MSKPPPPTRPFVVATAEATTARLRCGADMPVVGLGGGIFDNSAEDAVASAVALGYRLVDTAPKYGQSEAGVGRAVARSGLPRKAFFLSTKVCCTSYEATMRSFERSLAALGTDYVDLLLMHSGVCGAAKKEPRSTRHAEARQVTWRAMRALQRSGRVRAVGVCNFSLRQLRQLRGTPDVVQLEFTPLLQRWDLLRYCRSNGIVVQAYGSGGGGWRLWRKHPELELMGRSPLVATAEAHGRSTHQVSLRWALQHGLCVIPKAALEQHQRENLELFGFELDDAQMAAIDALSANRSVYRFRDPDAFA